MTATVEKKEEAMADATNRAPGILGVRHLQVFMLFLAMLLGYALRVSMSVAIVAMSNSTGTGSDAEDFGWDQSERSTILSSFFWGYAIIQMPSGYIAGAWSGQKLLSCGMFLCGLLNLLIPIAAAYGGYIAVCACRVGMGLTQGCILPCTHTLLSKWVPPSERARLGTFAYAGAQMGTVVGLPISGLLCGTKPGWPVVFYLFGTVTIFWALFFYFWGSDTPAEHSRISSDEKLYIETSLGSKSSLDEAAKQKVNPPWKEIFTSTPMIALIIAHCGQVWGYWTLLMEMPSYMNSVLQFNIEENGLISGLPYLVMWILSFPMSWLSDFALRKGIARGLIRKVCNTIAFWGPALALVILGVTPTGNSTIAVMILVFAVGLNAGSLCGFQINHIDLSPNYAGTMVSITNCLASIVSIIVPLVCGEVLGNDESNTFRWGIVFYISAVIYFISNFIFIIFGKAEIQWWNDPEAVKARRQEEKKSVAA